MNLINVFKDLHDEGIYHGDINSGNIIFSEQSRQFKIIYFGKSYWLQPGDKNGKDEMRFVKAITQDWQ